MRAACYGRLRNCTGLPDCRRAAATALDFVVARLPGGGVALLRPQLMRDADLLPSLGGGFAGQPALWRAHVDRHVFFWACPVRRDRFLAAVRRLRARSLTAPLQRPASVLTIRTAPLLARHGADSFVSRVNIGSTLRGGARIRRDEATLCPVASWRGGTVAELAIRGAVELSGLLAQPPTVAAIA